MAQTQLPLQLAGAVTVHKTQGPTLPRTRLALGGRESLTGLIFIEKLDWELVKNMDGIFLQLQLEDLAHRYQLEGT